MRALGVIVFFFVPGMVAAATGGTNFSEQHERAAASLGARQWEAAARIYREIIERGPDDPLLPNACLGLARCLAGSGSREKALSILQGIPAKISGRGWGREGVNLWRYAAYRERARILGGQGNIDGAEREFRNAVGIIGEAGVNEGLRARTRIEAAELLSAAGRRKEAIVLLSAYPEELKASHRAGLRAHELAVLARIYLADGERDWAVTLLERIRDHPDLDEGQYHVAEAFVEGRDWKRPVTGKLRTRRVGDTLRIESEGRFELAVAFHSAEDEESHDEAGTITAWFDLESDPFKTTNLVGPPGGSLLRFAVGRKSTERGPHGTVEVIEESAARVRFRTRQRAWPHRVESYSIYPTGQIFVGTNFALEAKKRQTRIERVSLHTALNSEVNWMQSAPGVRRMIGEMFFAHESPFLLARSNSVPAPQISLPDDLLLVPASAGAYPGYFLPGRITLWSRMGMHIPCPPTGDRFALACQLRVYPRTIDSISAAKPYVDDYQSPAKVEVRAGAVVKNDPGDLNGDGYNESEGCYVVSGTGGAALVAGDRARHQPAIKFLAVDIQGLPDLGVNGKLAAAGTYNLARLDKESFLVQWLGVVKRGVRMDFSLK